MCIVSCLQPGDAGYHTHSALLLDSIHNVPFECRDGDHRLTQGDVLGAIGPLMYVAQAGIVFMGSSEEDSRKAATVWQQFRDGMRELATDKVAAAIATGAFEEVDSHHSGRIQGGQGIAQCSALFCYGVRHKCGASNGAVYKLSMMSWVGASQVAFFFLR